MDSAIFWKKWYCLGTWLSWCVEKDHLRYTNIFPITMYGHESWTMKKVVWGWVVGGDRVCFLFFYIINMLLVDSLSDILKHQKDEEVGHRANQPLVVKTMKLGLLYFGHIVNRQDLLERSIILWTFLCAGKTTCEIDWFHEGNQNLHFTRTEL